MRVQICDGRVGQCGEFIELDGAVLEDYLARKWVVRAKVEPVAEVSPKPEPAPVAPTPEVVPKPTKRFDKK